MSARGTRCPMKEFNQTMVLIAKATLQTPGQEAVTEWIYDIPCDGPASGMMGWAGDSEQWVVGQEPSATTNVILASRTK